MIRGIDGRRVFRAVEERLDFLDRLDALLPEAGTRCLAWAVQPNHAHLVLQSGEVPLSRVMHRLEVGFARVFNLRRDRRGYVFQGRFKSRLIRDDADLMGVTRYVHRNPLEDGLVDRLARLERHPWCGYSAAMGARPARRFESIRELLALYAADVAEARRRLRRWMAADGDGVEAADDAAGKALGTPPGRASPPERGRAGASLAEIVSRICDALGVAAAELESGSRRRALSEARAAIAYVAVCRCGLPGARVAGAVGVGRSAISQALERGREVARSKLNY